MRIEAFNCDGEPIIAVLAQQSVIIMPVHKWFYASMSDLLEHSIDWSPAKRIGVILIYIGW